MNSLFAFQTVDILHFPRDHGEARWSYFLDVVVFFGREDVSFPVLCHSHLTLYRNERRCQITTVSTKEKLKCYVLTALYTAA